MLAVVACSTHYHYVWNCLPNAICFLFPSSFMNTRLRLKRGISAGSSEVNMVGSPFKKIKLRAGKYETPHPTASSQEEVYKLPSSVGAADDDDNLSPVPTRRTSSNGLKENAINRPTKTYKSRSRSAKDNDRNLASPFHSRPNSTGTSPHKNHNNSSSNVTKLKLKDRMRGKRTLSDKQYNPNLPRGGLGDQGALKKSQSKQSLRTTNSPRGYFPVQFSPNKPRRPSAPTPPRTSTWVHTEDYHGFSGTAGTGTAQNIMNGALGDTFYAEFFAHGSGLGNVDFNRPPSQLSLYDYNGHSTLDFDLDLDKSALSEGFFANAQGISTPFRVASATATGTKTRKLKHEGSDGISRSITYDYETDTDSEEENADDPGCNTSLGISSSLASRKPTPFYRAGSGYITPANQSEDEGDVTYSQGGRANHSGSRRVERSPWISDSLISPPGSMEWNMKKDEDGEDAYMRVDGEKDAVMDDGNREEDENMEDVSEEVLEEMFDSLIIDGVGGEGETIIPPTFPPTASLKSHLEPMSSPQNRPKEPNQSQRIYARTRSLDSAAIAQAEKLPVISRNEPVTGRKRRSTIKASDFSLFPAHASSTASGGGVAVAPARRTRSGTIVSSTFNKNINSTTNPNPISLAPSLPILLTGRRTRSGTVVSLAPSLAVLGEKNTAPSHISRTAVPKSRRSRSGTVTVGPPSLAKLPTGDPGNGGTGNNGSNLEVEHESGSAALCLSFGGDGNGDDDGNGTVERSADAAARHDGETGSSPDPLSLFGLDVELMEPQNTHENNGGGGRRARTRTMVHKAAIRVFGKRKAGLPSAGIAGTAPGHSEVDGEVSEDELLLKPGFNVWE